MTFLYRPTVSSAEVQQSHQRWRTLIGVVRLLRPSNALPASALVLIGAERVSGWPLSAPVWWAAAAMLCVTAYGYVSNDCSDVAEDSVNKPDRPIAAGLVTPGTARGLAIGLAVAALGLSLLIGLGEAAVALLVMGLLTLYNGWLKGTPGGGNLLIAGLAGGTLLTGGVAVRGFDLAALAPLAWPSLLLTLFVAAREIVKTLEDTPGDRRAGKRTVAIQLGPRRTVGLITVLTALLTLLSGLAVLIGGYSWLFLAVMTGGVIGPLLFTLLSLWPEAPPLQVRRALRLLKGSYFAGIVALLLA